MRAVAWPLGAAHCPRSRPTGLGSWGATRRTLGCHLHVKRTSLPLITYTPARPPWRAPWRHHKDYTVTPLRGPSAGKPTGRPMAPILRTPTRLATHASPLHPDHARLELYAAIQAGSAWREPIMLYATTPFQPAHTSAETAWQRPATQEKSHSKSATSLTMTTRPSFAAQIRKA